MPLKSIPRSVTPALVPPPPMAASTTSRLAEMGTFLQRSTGRVLCSEKQVQREVLVVLAGEVVVASEGAPRWLLRENSRIGDPSLVGRRLWGETVSTLTPVELVVFSRSDLHRIAGEMPDLFAELSAS